MGKQGVSYSRAFKLEAIARMEAGENVSALALELGVARVMLYRWRDQQRAGGPERFRDRRGRPTKQEAVAMAAALGPAREATSLAEARREITELERKVGRQQRDLDFFRAALQHFEGSRQPSDRPGATASSPSSRR
jgi:transposase